MFIPRDKRPYVCAVYAFARTADDFADEGNFSRAARLRKLDEWQEKLDESYRGKAVHPVFLAIAETFRRTGLPRQLLSDLLTAFRMDVTKNRYVTFGEVLEYCSYSANPVGRLVLHIFEAADERFLPLSDSICTGLQLANFWQDISVDLKKGRLYVPLEDLERFGYTEKEIAQGKGDGRFAALMKFQVDRTRRYLIDGSPLIRQVPEDLRLELALTVRGGKAILKGVEKLGAGVLHRRPSLSALEKALIVFSAFAESRGWTSQPRQ